MDSVNVWHSLPRPAVVLAPMHGVTDQAFRRIARECGADLVVSEFTSVDALHHGAEVAIQQITPHATEHPYLAQVFGNEPEHFAAAAKVAERVGADGIDINFGCPAPKVVQSGSGCALFRDLPRVRAIVEATVNATKLPVSVKTRTGMLVRSIQRHVPEYQSDRERITVLEFLDALKGLAVAGFTLHARSYEQGFAGNPDWMLAKQAVDYYRQNFPGGVALVNGAIRTPEDAKVAIEATGADGVAIGQGAMGNPWLFGSTRQLLRRDPFIEPTRAEIVAGMLRHAAYAEESKGGHGITELRKHFGWYVKGWPSAAELRGKLVRVTSGDEARSLLEPLSSKN